MPKKKYTTATNMLDDTTLPMKFHPIMHDTKRPRPPSWWRTAARRAPCWSGRDPAEQDAPRSGQQGWNQAGHCFYNPRAQDAAKSKPFTASSFYIGFRNCCMATMQGRCEIGSKLLYGTFREASTCLKRPAPDSGSGTKAQDAAKTSRSSSLFL